MHIKAHIKRINEGEILDESGSEELFDAIFAGGVTEIELAALLIGLKVRKETAPEVAGAVRSMRKCARALALPQDGLFDTCGTGGDNSHSFNISSAVAIILNAMGASIAKHGNRSMSSRSGSADFLEALNIPIALMGEDAAGYFARNRFLFLFAPNYHPAMKHAVPVRKALGVRTIFNFLGPLTNPASPRRQVIGVFHPKFLPLYAGVVSRLGYERVLLYSAINGMDEVSPVEPTLIYDVRGDAISRTTVTPGEFISPEEAACLPHHLTPQENAAAFLETIRSGSPTPLGKLLALNTALALTALKDDGDIASHYRPALEAIHGGAAYDRLLVLQERAQ